MTGLLIVEYRSAWPAQFEAAAAELARVFSGWPVCIEHIGSTAVPGLCAKPVLDIVLAAAEWGVIESCIPALAACGYTYRPEYETALPQRRYFTRAAGHLPRIHLHTTLLSSALWQQHLAFRDALRNDPAQALGYAALKRELAATHGGDKSAYTAAKAPFISQVLHRLAAP